MQHAGADVGHVHLEGAQPEAVDETRARVTAAPEGEGNDTGTAFGQVFFCEGVIRARGEAGIIDELDLRMAFQEGGHLFGVAAVAVHAHGKGLQAHVQIEGALRGLTAAEVAHDLHPGLDDKGGFAEGLRVDGSVVGRIGIGEFGEFA